MSISTIIQRNTTAGGVSFNERQALTSDAVLVQKATVPAAKASSAWELDTGGLTGTATLAASHGITTAQVVDVYWVAGVRYGVAVGTVSGTSVPLTNSGTGDALPADSTSLFIAPRVELDFPVEGDNLVGLLMSTAARGSFVVRSSGATELTKTLAASAMYTWYDGSGESNPITGDTIVSVVVSQASTASAIMSIAALVNN